MTENEQRIEKLEQQVESQQSRIEALEATVAQLSSERPFVFADEPDDERETDAQS